VCAKLVAINGWLVARVAMTTATLHSLLRKVMTVLLFFTVIVAYLVR
jgi:hypothetical protein